jgi:hypothetical protein
MITYLYWGAVIALVIACMAIFAGKMNSIRTALISSAVVLIAGWVAYYFYFEQLFVKRYGGVMSISVPAGQHHIAVTWKDDNLWVENYEPATNTCIFSEYSRGNLLQGKVVLKDCNPLMPNEGGTAAVPTAKSSGG